MALNKIKTASITDDAVNADKLAAGSVTNSELNKTAITGQTELSETANDADFTIIDLNKKVTIKNKIIASKCKWTPFHNMKIKGFPYATIVNGEVKMLDGKIIGKPDGKVVKFD